MALTQVIPIMNSLPDDMEEPKEKGKTLFGGGFLEKATKRIEEEKLLAKVAGAGCKPPPAKSSRQDNKDPNNLHRFWRTAPLQDIAAGTPGAGSRTPRKFQRKNNNNAIHKQWTKNN